MRNARMRVVGSILGVEVLRSLWLTSVWLSGYLGGGAATPPPRGGRTWRLPGTASGRARAKSLLLVVYIKDGNNLISQAGLRVGSLNPIESFPSAELICCIVYPHAGQRRGNMVLTSLPCPPHTPGALPRIVMRLDRDWVLDP